MNKFFVTLVFLSVMNLSQKPSGWVWAEQIFKKTKESLSSLKPALKRMNSEIEALAKASEEAGATIYYFLTSIGFRIHIKTFRTTSFNSFILNFSFVNSQAEHTSG